MAFGGAAIRAGDIDAAFGGALAVAAVVVRGDHGGGPLAEDALGDAGQSLAGAPSDERDERALMVCVERAGAEGFAHLLRELAVRAERGIELAINFADHAVAGAFRDALGQEALNL